MHEGHEGHLQKGCGSNVPLFTSSQMTTEWTSVLVPLLNKHVWYLNYKDHLLSLGDNQKRRYEQIFPLITYIFTWNTYIEYLFVPFIVRGKCPSTASKNEQRRTGWQEIELLLLSQWRSISVISLRYSLSLIKNTLLMGTEIFDWIMEPLIFKETVLIGSGFESYGGWNNRVNAIPVSFNL